MHQQKGLNSKKKKTIEWTRHAYTLEIEQHNLHNLIPFFFGLSFVDVSLKRYSLLFHYDGEHYSRFCMLCMFLHSELEEQH